MSQSETTSSKKPRKLPRYTIDQGILNMVMNALERDAVGGNLARKEMLEEIRNDIEVYEEPN